MKGVERCFSGNEKGLRKKNTVECSQYLYYALRNVRNCSLPLLRFCACGLCVCICLCTCVYLCVYVCVFDWVHILLVYRWVSIIHTLYTNYTSRFISRYEEGFGNNFIPRNMIKSIIWKYDIPNKNYRKCLCLSICLSLLKHHVNRWNYTTLLYRKAYYRSEKVLICCGRGVLFPKEKSYLIIYGIGSLSQSLNPLQMGLRDIRYDFFIWEYFCFFLFESC